MGQLDDAIREHLELKRRRGGDPEEIARAEQEALRPLDFNLVPAWAQTPAELEAPPVPLEFQQAPEASPFDGATMLESFEQETVEVDMAAVIAADATALAPEPHDSAPGGEAAPETVDPVPATELAFDERTDPAAAEQAPGPIRARRITRGAAEPVEDFEWETPAPRAAGAPGEQEPAPQESFALE